MKIRRLEAKLFNADGRTDWYGEANSRFSSLCDRPKKLNQISSVLKLLDLFHLQRAEIWLPR